MWACGDEENQGPQIRRSLMLLACCHTQLKLVVSVTLTLVGIL